MNAAQLAQAIIDEARSSKEKEDRRISDEVDAFDEETGRMVRDLRKAEFTRIRKIEEERKRQLIAKSEKAAQLKELTCKRELLDALFEKALGKAAQLKGESRERLLKKLLARTSKEIKDPTLIAAKKDKAFLAKDAKILKTIESAGGFIAQNAEGTIRLDVTFETLIENVRMQHTEEIAQLVWRDR